MTNPPRVRADRGWTDGKKLPACRHCGGALPAGRRSFCSGARTTHTRGGAVLTPGHGCVHEWLLRSQAAYLRAAVWDRDHGVCAECGEQCDRNDKPWEADHIVPVHRGGGQCGLDNMRTLCRPCHVRVTAQQARNRMAKKQTKKTSNGIGHNPGAVLTKPELDARTADLVAAMRECESVEEAKKAASKKFAAQLKKLKTRRDELLEELETGLLHPTKRQTALPLDPPMVGDPARANGEPEPQGDGSVKTNSAQAKRKRASRKANAGEASEAP